MKEISFLRSLKKVKVKVIQLCLTLCDTIDCSLPGSSVYEILQARKPDCPTQGLNPGLQDCSWILY